MMMIFQGKRDQKDFRVSIKATPDMLAPFITALFVFLIVYNRRSCDNE